jgi:transcriptional regulator
MYRPPPFREDRAEILHQAIRDHPLGSLVTAGPAGLLANLLPFTLVDTAAGPVLRAHLARANDQLTDLRSSTPALVLFHGPQAYVTPAWYAAKATHGKVVPTWNYVTVQVRGTPRVIDDAQWLGEQIERLTHDHEGARERPWSVSDAPADFIASQLRAIAGIEILVTQIEGKWKVSQNRSAADRAMVATGLAAEGKHALAQVMQSLEPLA